jgi:hypothetical protein
VVGWGGGILDSVGEVIARRLCLCSSGAGWRFGIVERCGGVLVKAGGSRGSSSARSAHDLVGNGVVGVGGRVGGGVVGVVEVIG